MPFLSNDHFERLVRALVEIKPCPHLGKICPEQVSSVLLHVANVRPIPIVMPRPRPARDEDTRALELMLSEMELAEIPEGYDGRLIEIILGESVVPS